MAHPKAPLTEKSARHYQQFKYSRDIISLGYHVKPSELLSCQCLCRAVGPEIGNRWTGSKRG